jgi:aspartyl-tRNA(Asn)/glutamyl-tRNA(Gln) amidotransferase subunit B
LQQKYMQDYQLSAYDAAMICADRDDAAFYDSIIKLAPNYKSVANWLTGPVRNYCNDNNIEIKDFPLNAEQLASLITFTDSGKVHFNVASSKLLEAFIKEPSSTPEALASSLNLLQESDSDALRTWVDEAIASMPDKVKEYKSGKKGLIGLFAGQVKKLSKGKADMQAVTAMLEERLGL